MADPADPADLVGVAATAALVSDRPKRGEHRAHVAVASTAGTTSWSLTLDKGRRDRAGEDRLVSWLVLCALAEACGVDPPGPSPLGEGDVLTRTAPIAGR